MRVLVIGATGQLGSDIVERFIEADDEVFDLPSSVLRLGVTTSVPDVLVKYFIERSIDLVVNCAAYHNLRRCEDEPAAALHINANAVADIALACARTGRLFMHISTDYVFGGRETHWPGLDESVAPAPVNVYGASKLQGEAMARAVLGDRLMVVRVSGLFGKTPPSGKPGNFVDMVVKKVLAGEQLRVIDDQIVTPTYTWTAAQYIQRLAHVHAAKRSLPIVHVSGGRKMSWYQFAELIWSRIVENPDKAIRVISTGTPVRGDEGYEGFERPHYSALSRSLMWAIMREAGIAPPEFTTDLEHYLAMKGVLRQR